MGRTDGQEPLERKAIAGLLWRLRAWLIVGGLVAAAALSGPRIERMGDSLQIALPVAAVGCSVLTGAWGETLVRYAAQWSVVQGSKSLLGDRPINRRPNGNLRGFPSGHTATAVFGASNLAHECLRGSPWAQGAVLLAAGFVGGSRIEARAHDLRQVMAGALVGWLGDRLLRRGRGRARVARLLARLLRRRPRHSTD